MGDKLGKKHSNLRKRRSKDQQALPSDSQGEDTGLSSSGRPKRKCTLNQKKNYLESGPTKESADLDYNQENIEICKPSVSKKVQTTPTRTTTSGTVITDSQKNKLPTEPDLTELKAKYKWVDRDNDTGKVRCQICVANNLKKWFIIVIENNDHLSESLRLHELSDEHQRASHEGVLSSQKRTQTASAGESPAPVSSAHNNISAVKISSNLLSPSVLQMRKASIENAVRDVYCIPMECVDPIPLPGSQLRNILARHGLKGVVNFASDLTPGKLREDISMAFSKTFNLRTQEALQFDYLLLNEEKDELIKPDQVFHYVAKTVLSFFGDNNIYILLKQKAPTQNVDWKQLMFQEKELRNLGDEEYNGVMICVMNRLRSGKHKKGSSEGQKSLVESLISYYKLNSCHQLVYIGNTLDQLVLFTEKRRFNAFQNAHDGHPDLQTTFKNIFKSYYWNGVEEWVTHQVKNCDPCLNKYGKNSLSAASISLDKIEEELKEENKEAESSQPLAPRPLQQPACVQRKVPILQETAPAPTAPPKKTAPTDPPKQTAPAASPKQTAPAPTASPKQTAPAAPPKKTGSDPTASPRQSTDHPVASIIPPMPMPKTKKKPDPETSLSLQIKKEPEPDIEKNGLLPPEDDMSPGESDQAETLYEEDLEKALTKNSSDESYCDNTFRAMHLLQQHGMFCDFFIMLMQSVYNNLKRPKVYGVHRIVFAAVSSRIRKITNTTIKIGGNATCQGLEDVIEYCYTGCLTSIHKMTLQNITRVSNTALVLDIEIDRYLQNQRPDFKKTLPKIMVTRKPGDASSSNHEGSRIIF